jgi:signal transduction histidine kinase
VKLPVWNADAWAFESRDPLIRRGIGFKLLAISLAPLILGIGGLIALAIYTETRDLLEQNLVRSRLLATTIEGALPGVMLEGRADIARQFLQEVQRAPGVSRIEIYRRDGTPAFQDSSTVQEVRRREPEVRAYEYPPDSRPLRETDPRMIEVMDTAEEKTFYQGEGAEEALTHLLPIANQPRCYRCHGSDHEVRGAVLITTSMAEVRDAIRINRNRLLAIGALTVLAVGLLLTVLLRRYVLNPMEEMVGTMRQVAKGGTFRPVRAASRDEMGELAVAFNRMTEELHRREAELRRTLGDLRQMQTQLIQTEKLSALGLLISGVAHEINNPLTVVLGYAELLMETHGPPEFRRDLERIRNEALRIKRIVQNLLTFARDHKPERQLVDVNEILRQTLALREHEVRLGNVAVHTRLDEGIPALTADAHQLRQVFLNLILNAEQAMTEATGRGTLEVVSGFHPPSTVRVAITDSGPGIPAEHLPKIFDPFFTTKGVGKGTGLGLSVSYGIVKEHGGEIRVASRPGRTTFTVELPTG